MASRDYNYIPDEPRQPQPPIPIRPPRRALWKRVLGWTLLGLFLLILAAGIGLVFYLRSASFHNYALNKVQTIASEKLNTPVRLQNFALNVRNLSLDLYGVNIEGTGPGKGQPLLLADHLNLDLNVTSVFHKEWYVENVTIDHPVVKLIVDKSGANNLPTPQSSNSNSSTNVFDLGVRHALLDRGEVYYNDTKTPMWADLHDLRLQSSYDRTDNGRYYGTLGYRDGHLRYGAYQPITHDLQAQFDARRSGLHLSNVTFTTQPLVLKADLTIQNYSNPSAQANYNATVYGGELRRLLNDSTLPIGEIAINGNAQYQNKPNAPLLDLITASGQVSSRELLVRNPQINTAVRNLGLKYSLANGNAAITDLRAGVLGGEVTGNATVRNLSGTQRGDANLRLQRVSLADLKKVANTASLNQVAINGDVNGTVNATWAGSVQNVVARTDLSINSTAGPVHQPLAAKPPSNAPGTTASNQPLTSSLPQNNTQAGQPSGPETPTVAQAGPIPLQGEIHAIYNGAKKSITLNHSYLRTPETTLNLNGAISNNSALKLDVRANNLHELERIADIFRTTKAGEPPPAPLNLSGRLAFQGEVTHSMTAPELRGHLSGTEVSVHGSTFRTLQSDVDASPSHVALTNGLLEPPPQGRMTFNVRAGLKDWSFKPDSPISASVNANSVAIAPFAKAANLSTPVSGILDANINVQGSEENPVGQGRVSLTNANIAGQPIQSANVNFQGNGTEVHSNLLVRTSAGNASGQLTYYPKTEGYDAALQATNIQLAKLSALEQQNLDVAGTLNLTASGRGTIKDPQGQASLTIPQLTVKGQQITDVNLQAGVANHQATFNFGSNVLKTPLRAQGKVGLTGDYYTEASLDTPVIALQPLIATYAPAQANNVSGQTEIHATVRGPLKNKERLEAHLTVPTLQVQYQQIQIGAVQPIRADYLNGVLTLQPGEIRGTDTDIRYGGRVPLTGNAPMQLTMLGNINLSLVHLFDEDIYSDGQVQFDINAAGKSATEDVQGQIRIVNANFAMADAPVSLNEGNGVLTLRRDRLDVTQFTGKVGGGTVTASGAVVYRPAIQFDVALKSNDIRLLYPQGLRTDLDLNMAMTGGLDSSLLRGQVNINRVMFTPDFDMTTFSNQFSGESSPPPTQGFTNNLKLNINVRTTNELNAMSRTMNVQGDANLRVVGTAADPVILGRASLTGGELFLLGNRYVIQGGTIAFVNPVRTEPDVNLQVNTTIQQYNIAMRFQGPIDRLHTNYTSDPGLPPADIINLIAFGKTQEAQAAQAQPGNLGAESLVASQVSGQVTNRVEKIAGISHLSVDPVLAQSGNQNPGARVTIQQRVTSKLYVTFATDVTQTQNEEIQLEYHVNRKWSVSGNRDQNGGFGLDGRYHKDF